jgi:methyltransferase (TIGR00027 family)
MLVAFWRCLGDLGITTVPHFSDPAARQLLRGRFWRFMAARGEALARNRDGKTARGFAPYVDGIVLRVAFIDAVIAASATRQVVILGAGLDTRAWRLPALRGVRVFEVDHPATQAYKRENAPRLGAPLADLRFVAIDFTRDDLAAVLKAAGYDSNVPTVWVWEGVIMYLDDAALRSTLNAVRRLSAPGSTLIAHYFEPEATESAATVRKILFSWLGEPQIGLRTRATMRDEITRAGFRMVEDAGVPEQAARVGASAPNNDRVRVSRISVAN